MCIYTRCSYIMAECYSFSTNLGSVTEEGEEDHRKIYQYFTELVSTFPCEPGVSSLLLYRYKRLVCQPAFDGRRNGRRTPLQSSALRRAPRHTTEIRHHVAQIPPFRHRTPQVVRRRRRLSPPFYFPQPARMRCVP